MLVFRRMRLEKRARYCCSGCCDGVQKRGRGWHRWIGGEGGVEILGCCH